MATTFNNYHSIYKDYSADIAESFSSHQPRSASLPLSGSIGGDLSDWSKDRISKIDENHIRRAI